MTYKGTNEMVIVVGGDWKGFAFSADRVFGWAGHVLAVMGSSVSGDQYLVRLRSSIRSRIHNADLQAAASLVEQRVSCDFNSEGQLQSGTALDLGSPRLGWIPRIRPPRGCGGHL